MHIAILALQGAFAEHRKMLESLGAEVFEIRQKKDLTLKCDALILPGGESTTQGKLLRELELFEPLKKRIADGLPVLATCAGTILLAKQLADDPVTHFATMPIVVRRNAYGRQLSSFYADSNFSGIDQNLPMPFIRAPQIVDYDAEVELLASVGQKPVAVRYGNQVAMTFHPEITGNPAIHRCFLEKTVIPARKS
ncbi:MAG: pyridoxal 5'-phosphate synthase glutaminase subunit PdxT [Lentisphaeria bacterium]|nr:pyridoxal 5'-phosphate synthase glutaminase subunit PdxT [Lentisphaeria bacterium]